MDYRRSLEAEGVKKLPEWRSLKLFRRMVNAPNLYLPLCHLSTSDSWPTVVVLQPLHVGIYGSLPNTAQREAKSLLWEVVGWWFQWWERKMRKHNQCCNSQFPLAGIVWLLIKMKTTKRERKICIVLVHFRCGASVVAYWLKWKHEMKKKGKSVLWLLISVAGIYWLVIKRRKENWCCNS